MPKCKKKESRGLSTPPATRQTPKIFPGDASAFFSSFSNFFLTSQDRFVSDRMQVGLDHSSSSRYPGDSGSDFRTGPEIDSSAEASWRSHFDHPTTTMATSAGNDTVSNTVSTATAIPPNDDITAGQRMFSASAGNILTGLLGECFSVPRSRCFSSPSLLLKLKLSHPPRCRTRSITITNRQKCQSITIYLTYSSDIEEFTPEYWNYGLLPRGLLGRRKCANVYAGTTRECN